MIIRLNITEDILKIIPSLYIQTDGDDRVLINRKWLMGGSHVVEDVALAIGKFNDAIKGTEDDPEGRAWSEDDTKYMLELHKYIVDNLFYLESLIHQFVVKGGLEVGVYSTKDNELVWKKEK